MLVHGNDEVSHAEVGCWRYVRHLGPLSNLVPMAMVLLKPEYGSARRMKGLFYGPMIML